ncbi:MAG: hypothetical protein A2Z34_11045 [Planctomycetes bacterium RBG_16_59_8]|nr:MAG: hypothetical protein A2Z34_11045 [Planctomycetes bacterium RBG_16_59_8]
MRRLNILVLAIFLSGVGFASADERTISTAEAGVFSFSSIAIRGGEAPTVVATTPEGAKEIGLAEIVEINLSPLRPSKENNARLLLTSGEILYGKLIEKTEQGIRMSGASLGEITVPMEHLSAIHLVANQKFLPKELRPVDEDVVILTSGDRDAGVIEALNASDLVINSSRFKSQRTLKLADIAAILLAQLSPPPKPPEGLHQDVVTVDGSLLRGTITSLDNEKMAIATLLGGSRELPTDRISGIFVRNGKIIWLSDIEPSNVDENANYIRLEKHQPGDISFPYQKDKNILGGPIAIKGRGHKKGIGVHSFSSLTWPLGRKFKTFSVSAGIDDCSAGNPDFNGDVVFKVFLNGNRTAVQETGNLRGGDSPRDITVDVSDAESLTLVVEFGGEGNIRDYADWGSARLLKK